MNHFYESIPGWFNPQTYSLMVKTAKSGSTFVEVGVFKGRSAAFMATEIVNSGKDIKFYAVDHFEGSPEHGNIKDTLFTEAMSNLQPVIDAGAVTVIPLPSLEAVNSFEDESVDFVFIDAAHDYESVKADIYAWWSKVKSGGILAGDDYQPSWQGVIQAVNEFSSATELPVLHTHDTCHWLIIKP
jgi:predicted O-methyltransferase YrrM